MASTIIRNAILKFNYPGADRGRPVVLHDRVRGDAVDRGDRYRHVLQPVGNRAGTDHVHRGRLVPVGARAVRRAAAPRRRSVPASRSPPTTRSRLDLRPFNSRYAAQPWGRFEVGQRVEVELPLAVLSTHVFRTPRRSRRTTDDRRPQLPDQQPVQPEVEPTAEAGGRRCTPVSRPGLPRTGGSPNVNYTAHR